ncbi:alkaline phosphatase family protein [Brevundimonas lutea]|uniref:alkaline phosphatase family protein n=1 Tax=Brevundimonas lutea TaxID=2293980 RepID=UPI001F0C99D4|nr:alkaline phosphatase family protein [Brevundimonas lutea]
MSKSLLIAAASGLALLALPAIAQEPTPTAPAQAETPGQRPALVVMIVIDQFSANLMNQYRSRFTGGLKRLIDGGVVYPNGYQAQGLTETCPGHATLFTAAFPTHAGIPANDWYDTATGERTYCLAAPDNALADGDLSDNGRVGPERLKLDALGDWLKAASPDSRVYAVSGKDRGAITLNSHTGDGAYWYVPEFGFTTFARPGEDMAARMAPIAELNSQVAEGFRVAPAAWAYASEACRALEGRWTINDREFVSTVPPANFAIDSSPLLDELTLQAAEHLIDGQQLGQRGVTDVLGVSLSATDRIGHGYGSQGPEMCEQMHRLDLALGEFLERLDQLPGPVLIALTADHGGADFPERTALRGHPEARRGDRELLNRTNAALRERFDLDADPLISDGMLYVVDGERRALPEPLKSQVAAATVELIRAEPTVAGAWTRAEVLAEPMPPQNADPEELTLIQRFRLSADAERGGDIMMALHPWITPGQGRVGGSVAGHGTPWDHDRRVPILFWWSGAAAQERYSPIRTVDIAPTLANAIGVAVPEGRDGRCLALGDVAPTCPD